ARGPEQDRAEQQADARADEPDDGEHLRARALRLGVVGLEGLLRIRREPATRLTTGTAGRRRIGASGISGVPGRPAAPLLALLSLRVLLTGPSRRVLLTIGLCPAGSPRLLPGRRLPGRRPHPTRLRAPRLSGPALRRLLPPRLLGHLTTGRPGSAGRLVQ